MRFPPWYRLHYKFYPIHLQEMFLLGKSAVFGPRRGGGAGGTPLLGADVLQARLSPAAQNKVFPARSASNSNFQTSYLQILPIPLILYPVKFMRAAKGPVQEGW